MLTSGLLFFFLAIAAAVIGFSGIAEAPMQQTAAFAIAVLFLALFVLSLRRRSNRPWR
ncbi:MAG: DUF1328 domain-containing protein [Betaproteobacteria bacterium]|nr:DUF1328 domain-containing protein [Betaproteobacteria bacterium]